MDKPSDNPSYAENDIGFSFQEACSSFLFSFNEMLSHWIFNMVHAGELKSKSFNYIVL